MARIFLYATYALAYEGTDFASLVVLLLIVFACLVATVRPYSQKFALYNYVDTMMISVLAVFFGSMALNFLENSPMHSYAYKFAFYLLFVTAALVPLTYITLVILKRLLWKRNSYLHKLITLCLRKRSNENVEDTLPDRLVHPSAYYRSCTLAEDNHTCESCTY